MSSIHNYKRQTDLQNRIHIKLLLIKENNRHNSRPVSDRLVALITGAILLAGLSGSLQALPKDTQSDYVESNLDLNFSDAAPITLSTMMVARRAETGNARSESVGYGLDSEIVVVDSTSTPKLRGYFQSEITLVQDSGKARLLTQKSEAIAQGLQRVMLNTAAHSRVNKLANNTDAALSESEDNLPEVGKPLVEEVVTSPFATIALTVLALLGLVSVARRNDI